MATATSISLSSGAPSLLVVLGTANNQGGAAFTVDLATLEEIDPTGGVVGPTTYYKMRALDSGAGYVTWIATGAADFAGVGYSGGTPTPVGAMVPGSAVVADTWTA